MVFSYNFLFFLLLLPHHFCHYKDGNIFWHRRCRSLRSLLLSEVWRKRSPLARRGVRWPFGFRKKLVNAEHVLALCSACGPLCPRKELFRAIISPVYRGTHELHWLRKELFVTHYSKKKFLAVFQFFLLIWVFHFLQTLVSLFFGLVGRPKDSPKLLDISLFFVVVSGLYRLLNL